MTPHGDTDATVPEQPGARTWPRPKLLDALPDQAALGEVYRFFGLARGATDEELLDRAASWQGAENFGAQHDLGDRRKVRQMRERLGRVQANASASTARHEAATERLDRARMEFEEAVADGAGVAVLDPLRAAVSESDRAAQAAEAECQLAQRACFVWYGKFSLAIAGVAVLRRQEVEAEAAEVLRTAVWPGLVRAARALDDWRELCEQAAQLGRVAAVATAETQGSVQTGAYVADPAALRQVLPEITLRRSRTQPETRLDVARSFLEREMHVELPEPAEVLAEAERED